MIVRNGAQTIERCIASVRPHVDEICVFLGGESTDTTVEILEQLAAGPGAPLIVAQGVWRGDYAEARNEAAALASSTHVLWTEDDEVTEGGSNLRRCLARVPDVDALYVRRVGVHATDSVQYAWMPRVVRSNLARWEGMVHESLEPTLRAARARCDAARPDQLRVIHHTVEAPGRHRHRALVDEALAGDWTAHLALCAARYLIRDGEYDAAADALRAIIGRCSEAHEVETLEGAWRELGYCAWKLGDEATDATAAVGYQRVREERLRLDTFARYMHDLDVAYPIDDDDPLWATFCDDPRTPDVEDAAPTARGTP
jgi:glycosyltransferase involved in cell wall biosynthesis